ncbi:MAG: pectin methylesterase [Pseudobutyrivibrio sp.]|nr:pectin methylesterase [Pseudobutyrivibrio sp.]
MKLTVGKSQRYTTIQEALTEAKNQSQTEDILIAIEPGCYHERLVVDIDNITIAGLGDNAFDTVIEYDLSAFEIMDDGTKRGTFRTQTVFVHGNNITFKNLTIANTAGDGSKAGQCLAINSEGVDITYENCRLLGHQDTIFTGPLPYKEKELGGFRGPMQYEPRCYNRQFFNNCYIEGTVDYIFGGAECYFNNCTIHSLFMDRNRMGYVTAASTPEGQATGFVFDNCRFEGDAMTGSVYLGRPWRNFARVTVKNSYLGEVIHQAHWHDWNKPDAHDTICYTESNNYGPGASYENYADFAHLE